MKFHFSLEPAASSSSASPELLTTPDLPKAPEQAHTPESPTSHSRDQRERRVDTSVSFKGLRLRM